MQNLEVLTPGIKIGITVVICTYNGGQTIERVLAALQGQTGLEEIPYEVVLVDNACTDDTGDRAVKAWGNSTIPFRIIQEARPGVSFARQAGYLAARHSLICYVDDDNFLHPDYLSKGFHFMGRHPLAGICGGFGVPVHLGERPPWLVSEEGAFALGPQGKADGIVPPERGYVYGAGSIMRREALDDLTKCGFPALLTGRKGAELTAGEDTEICSALRLLGWQIVQSRDLTFQHYLPDFRLSWDYCERLFYGFGKADVMLMLYNLFLRPKTFKIRIQNFFLRAHVRKRIRQAARKDALSALQPVSEGKRELLLQKHAKGRQDETARMLENGELWRCLAKVRKFNSHARSIKRRRVPGEGKG